MKCTIKDIANDTGLSLATISKYLNGIKILPHNQDLIEDSIRRLEYIPNKTAQTLRSRRTNTIAIFLPVISDYFWGSLCSYIEEYMQKHGYSVLISSYDSTQSNQSDVYSQLLNVQVDGAILIPEHLEKVNLAHLLKQGNIPFVYLDQIISDPKADAITSSNFTGAKEATEYLLNRGHRYLGVIGGDLSSYTNNQRVKGFHFACDEYNIPEEQRVILGGEFTPASAASSFQEMLSLPTRPTAILFLGYFMTVAAIQEISRQNILIPQDLSIITFDDDEIFSAYDPPVTVMVQDLSLIGKRTAELLLKRIQGDFTDFPHTEMIPTKLIERASVGKIKHPQHFLDK